MLLIVDVQKSAVSKPEIAQKIEKLQYEYDIVYVSQFTKINSFIVKFLDWSGYDDERLAFTPKKMRLYIQKNGILLFCLK